MPTAADEGRHPPGTGRWWQEAWELDFAAPDGSFAGFVRLTLAPNVGVAWYWAAVVRDGSPLLAVRDDELAVPRGERLEVRGEGIWAALTCETPLDHWSAGLEAFAVSYDDPDEAWRSERGDLVPLGFDLEWEALLPADDDPGPAGAGYVQACRVTGEVLVGTEVLELDVGGWRRHEWGVLDWWGAGWVRTPGGWTPDGAPVRSPEEAGDDRTQTLRFVPVRVPGDAGVARAERSLRRTGGAVATVGWWERVEP